MGGRPHRKCWSTLTHSLTVVVVVVVAGVGAGAGAGAGGLVIIVVLALNPKLRERKPQTLNP